jgi:CRISPR/Cas system-associated endonuclease Cas1
MTPEQMAILSSKRLSLALDLTEEQRGQVMELQLERAKERKAFMEERKNSEGSGKALSPEDRFNRLNDRLDKKLAYKVSMKKILSDTQYTRWENMYDHSKRKGQMDRRHHRHTGKK